MEFLISDKTMPTLKSNRMMQVIRENCETYIPESKDDVREVAAAFPRIEIKGKEYSGKSVSVNCNVCADILYICDNSKELQSIRISKDIQIVFDDAEIVNEEHIHVRLNVNNYETRLLNPRKISLICEIAAELIVYIEDECAVEATFPADCNLFLHTLDAEKETKLVTAADEKSFSISDQYLISDINSENIELLHVDCVISAESWEHIGTKFIYKGKLNSVCTIKNLNNNEIIIKTYQTPFSQIAEGGSDDSSAIDADFLISSLYFEMIDTINGEKAVDVEVHTVMQYRVLSAVGIKYFADAYSNSEPIQLRYTDKQVQAAACADKFSEDVSELILLPDDCKQILYLQLQQKNRDISEDVMTMYFQTEIVFINNADEYAAISRSFKKEFNVSADYIHSFVISDTVFSVENTSMNLSFNLSMSYYRKNDSRIHCIECIICESENSDKLPDFGAVAFVRVENESLWELAKKYHSSIETINAYNDVENLKDNMLMIPRCR